MSRRAFSALEWQIAARYIRSRRREGVISLIAWASFTGILLGVATLIIVMAVMNGFRADLLERILGVGGHAVVRPFGGSFEKPDDLVKRLQAVDGVVRVTPFIDAQVMVTSGQAARGAVLRGFTEDGFQSFAMLADNINAGDLSSVMQPKTIAIGQRLAERYGLEVGQSLSLIAPRGAVTPFGTAPRVRRYTIGAIFEVGLSEYDLNFIFTRLATASTLANIDMNAAALEIIVRYPDRIDTLRPALDGAIGDSGWLVDWQQANATLSGALKVERNVMFLILTLILLVASLNIVSGLVMLVKDKSRDIAVMRTMGATRGTVLRVFFITGASIGVAGTLVGLVVGIVFCEHIELIRQFISHITGAELFPSDVYFLRELPARIIPVDVAMVVGLALGLSFLSTLYPAWRASSLAPVEALRNE